MREFVQSPRRRHPLFLTSGEQAGWEVAFFVGLLKYSYIISINNTCTWHTTEKVPVSTR